MSAAGRTAAIPAMVNAHSHAFQRSLRGRGERPAPEAHAGDDFWSWREAMYRLAGELDPESMGALAARTYRDMKDDDVERLLARTAQSAAKGAFEPFKTSSLFDATATNPSWLGEEPERLKQLIQE